jgi:hypothetical protein
MIIKDYFSTNNTTIAVEETLVIVVMYQLVPTPKSFVGMMVMALGETC